MKSMASSSSNHQQNEKNNAFSGIEPPGIRRKVSESQRLFDVFINHRGPDVKDKLARQLYNSLQQLGIRAFLDCEEKEVGDSFPSTIETAIRSASVHVAIFSKTYAESPWCLAELVLMLKSETKIIPVFYGVKPMELRYIEKGVYADAFNKYEEKGRYLKNLKEWKNAVQSVSYITGWEFYNSKDCEDIVSAVQKEIERTKSLYVAKHPVGLHNLVQDFEKRCLQDLVQDFENQCGLEGGKDKVKAVGIFGMGGSGKTTLAKELFNRKHLKYNRACFLFGVREASAKGELPYLQIKLIKALFNEDPPNFQSIEEGTSYIKDRLKRSSFLSFLIILDDINHVEQLDALLIMDMLNKSINSLVILTTRDIGVLLRARITTGYNLKGLRRNDARELFCSHAFGQPYPATGYEDLVDAFLNVSGGLPLSIQVLGSHVCGRNRAYWCLEWDKVRTTLPGDIKRSLKISFDALDNLEKQIFLDIACFFIYGPKGFAMRIWEGCGWSAEHALQTLKEKCLLVLEKRAPYNEELYFEMHDHIRDLGREMSEEISTPRRLWRRRDLKFLEQGGFQTILAKTNARCFQSFVDRTMGAKITYFIVNSEEWGETSASLLWLMINLNGHPHTSIPTWIPLKHLQRLTITDGYLKRLWQSDVQAPSSLKELHIEKTILQELPDLSRMSNHLEKVFLHAKGMTIEGWSLLEFLIIRPRSLVVGSSTLIGELTSNDRQKSVTQISKLVSTDVHLSNFKLRGILSLNNRGQSPAIKPPISSLEKLEIKGQSLVNKVFISGYHYSNLQSLHLGSMENLTQVDLNMVTTLISLHLSDCKNLKSVSGIGNLTNLVELKISGCSNLEVLPCFPYLSCLKRVQIYSCEKLNCLELDNCTNLKTVYVSDLPKLVIFSICHCPELVELRHLEGLNCLERITIDGCRKLNCLRLGNCENLKFLSGNIDLAELEITDCSELEELASLTSLEKLTIMRCEKLENITLPTKLAVLIISKCPKLEELSSVAGLSFLNIISIERCQKLQNIVGIEDLPALKNMELSLCSNATISNSIHRLQRVPSESMTVIGSAVDGAKSMINAHLFSDRIGAEAVIQIDVHEDDSFVAAASLDLLATIQEPGSLSAIILCAVVTVHSLSLTECTDINLYTSTWYESFYLDIGEWIFTTVITEQDLINKYIANPKGSSPTIWLDRPCGNIRGRTIEKAYMVMVKKGEEWKTLHALKIIADQLLQK